MGDVVSIPLGFLAATSSILGIQQGLWPWMFPLMAFSLFIAGPTATLARSRLRQEEVWQAHRSHCYQRLAILGASCRQLASVANILMTMVDTLGFLLLFWPELVAWFLGPRTATNFLIFLAIDWQWRHA